VGLLTNEQGEVTSHRRYRPFGLDRVYGVDDPGEGHGAGFVGGTELRVAGVTTGLVLLGARVLDSDVGRFLSQDPLLQLVSQYAYALGNPVRYQDAAGRTPIGKSELSVAELEAVAAQADLLAARADVAATDFALKGAVFGVAALITGGALVFVIVGAGVGVVAAKLALDAAKLRLASADLRAQAAAIRALQSLAAGKQGEMPSPESEVRKQLILPDLSGSGLQLGPPVAPPGFGAPPVCGPDPARAAAGRAWLALVLLLLVGSLQWARRAERAP
jgi:RHS repeat-associated protein